MFGMRIREEAQLAYCSFLYCVEKVLRTGGGDRPARHHCGWGRGSYSDPGTFTCSLWNYSYLLQSALRGWVECAWGNTSQTPPSPSHLWLILIIIMEPNSPKKIQFAVPLFQSQIAPEAAEQVSGIGWGPVIRRFILAIKWKIFYRLHLPDFVAFQDMWMRNKLVSICICIWVALGKLLLKCSTSCDTKLAPIGKMWLY